MRILRTSAAVGVAALVGSVFGAITPAGATPNNSTSVGFAGYSATLTTHVHSASTAFTLSTLNCPPSGSRGVLLLVQIFNSKSHTAAVGGVLLGCQSGAAFYQPVVFINGAETTPTMTLTAGDQMTVSVSQTPSGASVVLSDVTHPASVTTTGPGGRDRVVNIGDAAVGFQGQPAGVPRFHKVIFSRDKVNHAAIGSLAPTAFDMVSSGGTTQITTSALNPGGTSFTTTWVHS
jgi:hypothetical protein